MKDEGVCLVVDVLTPNGDFEDEIKHECERKNGISEMEIAMKMQGKGKE